VKSLSTQVTKATSRIAEDIQAMQGIAGDVVSSLGGIARSITSVREAVSSITFAVEQQAAATREISASMQVASHGVSSIDQNLHALAG
jgi:methyl-accepting chemotaxis protein